MSVQAQFIGDPRAPDEPLYHTRGFRQPRDPLAEATYTEVRADLRGVPGAASSRSRAAPPAAGHCGWPLLPPPRAPPSQPRAREAAPGTRSLAVRWPQGGALA